MNQKKSTLGKIVFYFIIISISVIIVIPFLWMILLSFKTNNEIINSPLSIPELLNPENYKKALNTLDLLQMYGNTLFLVVIAVFFSTAFTFMSSFAIAKMSFKNNSIPNGIYLFLLLGLAVPVYILLFPIYRINLKSGILGSYLGLILPYIAVNISFNTLLFVGFLKDFPSELIEAPIMDGINLNQLCTRVVIPVMKPTFVTVILFNAIYIFNEFPFASTFLNDTNKYTLSLMASMFKGQYSMDYGAIIAASIMIIIPELVFYAFFQKYIISGMTEGAIKG